MFYLRHGMARLPILPLLVAVVSGLPAPSAEARDHGRRPRLERGLARPQSPLCLYTQSIAFAISASAPGRA